MTHVCSSHISKCLEAAHHTSGEPGFREDLLVFVLEGYNHQCVCQFRENLRVPSPEVVYWRLSHADRFVGVCLSILTREGELVLELKLF